MKRKLFSLLAAAVCFGVCTSGIAAEAQPAAVQKVDPFNIVKNHRTQAEIVLPFFRYLTEPEEYAAQELQNWIGEITGTHVPVRHDVTPAATPFVSGEPKSDVKVRIYIGSYFARKLFPADFRAIGKSDGFAVRTRVDEDGVRNIYLFGAIPRGTLHSVYAFLERNSDIIWARPKEALGTIFSETADFIVKDADFIDVPKSDFRAYQWIYHSAHRQEFEWQSRNRMNRIGGHARYGATFKTAGVGHGIQVYIPHKKYFETNPEYYPMNDAGKRSPSGGQICLLAYDMIPEYVNNMRAELAKTFNHLPRPETGKVDYFNLSIADNWIVCKCPKCVAPFVTEDGKTIQPDDPLFRSAQYYTFINKVAREIRKTNPNVTIGVYAYVFTSEPPPFKLEQNIRIEYCPFVYDEKTPVYNKMTNGKWDDFLVRWGKVSRHTQVREYFGWANKFPRAQAYRIRDNGIYYIKHNVKEFSCEHPTDSASKVYPYAEPTWDVSGMDTWLVTRMWWNAEQDLEALRDQYITRVYREAAPQMKKFHDMQRDVFYASKLPTYYSDDILPLISAYVMKPGIGPQLQKLLAEAYAVAKHPKSKELIARQQKHLAAWIEMAKNDKTVRANVPVVRDTKDIMNSFGAAVWEKAAATGDFIVADRGEDHCKPAKFRSTARLLHDRENIYIYFQCFTPDMKNLAVSKSKDPSIEGVPRGDIMEFFLGHASTGVYYQFMFDAGNPEDPKLDVIFDAKGQDQAWTCNWQRVVKRYDDRWEAIVKIPLAGIDLNVTQNNKLLFQPIRGKYYITEKDGKKRTRREMASWNGGWVHQMPAFGELTLNQD